MVYTNIMFSACALNHLTYSGEKRCGSYAIWDYSNVCTFMFLKNNMADTQSREAEAALVPLTKSREMKYGSK
jgi:hypothetical protein